MQFEIQEMLKKNGLSYLIPDFEPYILESIELKTASIDDRQVKVGRSKIGGLPDLPDQIEWPVWNNKHLSFIAQINLNELPNLEVVKNLPTEGMLSFFYSWDQDAWGYDPQQEGAWRVFHFKIKNLVRRTLPEDLTKAKGEYPSCQIEFIPSITIPDAESLYMENLGLEKFNRNYSSFHEEFMLTYHTEQIIHRLLGHPDTIQGPMELECQLASNGIYCGNPDGYKDARVPALKPGAHNWQLLLQIDSDDKASMMWGDVGRIYFWICKNDLANKSFDSTWFVFQCC